MSVITLTDRTMSRLATNFAGWHHQPSAEQWAGLRSLAAYLQSMADGTASANQFALCDLCPGMGKSQTAAAFTRSLLDDPRYDHVGTLVMVSRLAEIDSFVRAIGLREDEYAALASKANIEGRQRLALGLTGDYADRARVLFITQQRLALVSEHGRQFADMHQFFYQGSRGRSGSGMRASCQHWAFVLITTRSPASRTASRRTGSGMWRTGA